MIMMVVILCVLIIVFSLMVCNILGGFQCFLARFVILLKYNFNFIPILALFFFLSFFL